MTKQIEFMDGFDNWQGIDYYTDNGPAEAPFNSSPWMASNRVGHVFPLRNHRGATAATADADKDGLKYLTQLGTGYAGGTALSATASGYAPILLPQWQTNSNRPLPINADVKSVAVGAYLDFREAVYGLRDGCGGELFSFCLANSLDVQYCNLSFRYLPELNKVHVSVYGYNTSVAPDDQTYRSIASTGNTGSTMCGLTGNGVDLWRIQESSGVLLALRYQPSDLVQIPAYYEAGLPIMMRVMDFPSDGTVVSATYAKGYYYLLETGGSGGAQVGKYDLDMAYVSTIDISSLGYTNPLGIDYDQTNDEFYLLDLTAADTYQLHAINFDLDMVEESTSTFVVNSGNNFNFKDICADKYAGGIGPDGDYNVSVVDEGFFYGAVDGVGTGVAFTNRRLTSVPWDTLLLAVRYKGILPQGAATNCKVHHDGTYAYWWRDDDAGDTWRLYRSCPEGYDLHPTSLTNGAYSPDPVLLDPDTPIHMVWVAANALDNTTPTTALYIDGVNVFEDIPYKEGSAYIPNKWGIFGLSLRNVHIKDTSCGRIDDFWLMSSYTVDEVWTPESDFPTRWKISTKRPLFFDGSVTTVGDTKRNSVNAPDATGRVDEGYTYWSLGSEAIVRFRDVDVEGTVYAVTVNMAVTLEGTPLATSEYPSGDIRPYFGVTKEGATMEWDNTVDYKDPTPYLDFPLDTAPNETSYPYSRDTYSGLMDTQMIYTKVYETNEISGGAWTERDINRIQLNLTTIDTGV